MEKIKLNVERCKGCYLCVSVCPVNALSSSGKFGPKGYDTVQADVEACIGCGSCYKICPDCAIEIVSN